MIRRARNALAIAALVTAPVACLTNDSSIPEFPSNAKVYVFSIRTLPLLVYTFVDTATGVSLHQVWLTDRGFAGAACIGLVPNAAVTDTFGTFIFGYNGPNVGEVQQTTNGITDTVLKVFSPVPAEGTHGTWAHDTATGKVTLNWADGAQTQYFDPKADIRLIRDTLTTHAELSAFADSVHATWRVTWAHEACEP